jgi:cytoskeletal protein CcmA (bactofilin family)
MDSHFNKVNLSQAAFGLGGMLDLLNQGTANIYNLNANNFAVTNGGNSALSGNLAVTGNSALSGNLAVTGASALSDKLTVSAGGMDVTGASTIRGATTITDKLTITTNGMQVTGTSTFDTLIASSSDISGNVNAGTLSVTGASDLKGALTVGLTDAKVASKFNGDVEINGNFHVTGTGTKTILNTEELKVKDTTITIGEGNTADTVPMALEMAYKTGATDYKAGLRRQPGGGFMLFKDCVNDSDAVLYDSLRVDTLECFSDMNLKKNIVTIDGALDKLDGIRGVYHDWINTKQSEDSQIGVIAQEVQAVYPERVHETENGYLTVNYPKLTAVLLQSIKELKAMVLEICAKQAL